MIDDVVIPYDLYLTLTRAVPYWCNVKYCVLIGQHPYEAKGGQLGLELDVHIISIAQIV